MSWRKSSYSGSSTNCVEVDDGDGSVAVRDSKDSGGPVLEFDGAAWRAFVSAVKADGPSSGSAI